MIAIAKFLWIVVPIKSKRGVNTGRHKFNVYNPIAWLFLITVAIFMGFGSFFKTFYETIKETL